MTDSIFNGTAQGEPAPQAAPTNDQNLANQNEFLSQLVGPDKKFKTIEDLAKGKTESDRFVDYLQMQIKELKEETGKRVSAEEVAAQVKELLRQQSPSEVTPPALDETRLAEVVRQQLDSAKKEDVVKSNVQTVHNTMVARFGDMTKATEYLQAKSSELGMSIPELESLASRSPNAFYKLVGVDVQQQQSNPHSATMQQNSMNPQMVLNTQVSLEDHYVEMRAKDPKRYFSPEVQQERYRLVAEGKLKIK